MHILGHGLESYVVKVRNLMKFGIWMDSAPLDLLGDWDEDDICEWYFELDEDVFWMIKDLINSHKGLLNKADDPMLISYSQKVLGDIALNDGRINDAKTHLDKGLKLRTMTLPDKFIEQDKPELMYKTAGLDSKSLENKILDLLNSNIVIQKQK